MSVGGVPISASSLLARAHRSVLIIMKLNDSSRSMHSTPTFGLSQAAEANFPTEYGLFRIYGFDGRFRAAGRDVVEEAVVLTMGELTGPPPLLRIHSQCLTGDVFHSLR